MKTFVAAGDTITVTAPYNRLSGEGAKVGQIFGICANDALSGAELVIKTRGVFEITKIGSQAWAVGALVYWDDTNKRCTTVSTGNLLIGVAVVAVGSGAGETTGTVRLNGIGAANS